MWCLSVAGKGCAGIFLTVWLLIIDQGHPAWCFYRGACVAKNDVHLTIFFSWSTVKRSACLVSGLRCYLSISLWTFHTFHTSQLQHISYLYLFIRTFLQLSNRHNCAANSHWKLLQNLWNQHFSFLLSVQDKKKMKHFRITKRILHRMGYHTLYCRGWQRISCATYRRYLALFVPKLIWPF